VWFHIFSTRLECSFTSSPLVSSVGLGVEDILLKLHPEPESEVVHHFDKTLTSKLEDETANVKIHSKRVEKMEKTLETSVKDVKINSKRV
jgi:hypothetical protein